MTVRDRQRLCNNTHTNSHINSHNNSHTNSHVNSHNCRHLHEHSMSAIHKQQVCAALNKRLQALGRGLPLKALSRSLRDHVPSCEGCAQDSNEREDAHVAERGDEARCQPHTAKQQGVVPADTISQLVTFP